MGRDVILAGGQSSDGIRDAIRYLCKDTGPTQKGGESGINTNIKKFVQTVNTTDKDAKACAAIDSFIGESEDWTLDQVPA